MNQHEPVAQPSILRNLLVSQTTDNLSSKRPPQRNLVNVVKAASNPKKQRDIFTSKKVSGYGLATAKSSISAQTQKKKNENG
jgi:hypothetical protein